MRSTILIAGTALAVSAGPALAGGSAGSMHGTLGGAGHQRGINSTSQSRTFLKPAKILILLLLI